MSNKALQEAYVAGAVNAFAHRNCCRTEEAIRDIHMFVAQQEYPVLSQPRVVTVSVRGWETYYRIVDGVVETVDPWYSSWTPSEPLQWRPSRAFALVNGELFVDPDPESEWVAAGLDAVRELVENPTVEVDG